MNDEIELKPCPFCGSIEIHFSDSRGGAEGYMSCWNCDTRGPSENNKSSALSSWNERRNA